MSGNGRHSRNADEAFLAVVLQAAVRQGEACSPEPNDVQFPPLLNDGLESRVQNREVLRPMVEDGFVHPARREPSSHHAAFVQDDDTTAARVEFAGG